MLKIVGVLYSCVVWFPAFFLYKESVGLQQDFEARGKSFMHTVKPHLSCLFASGVHYVDTIKTH